MSKNTFVFLRRLTGDALLLDGLLGVAHHPARHEGRVDAVARPAADAVSDAHAARVAIGRISNEIRVVAALNAVEEEV